MNARYDDVIVALLNDELDRAIKLIEQIKEQRQTLLIHRITTDFELTQTEELPFEKTTDFLPFHGWEAA